MILSGEVAKLLSPRKLSFNEKVRIGRNGDGGYVMANPRNADQDGGFRSGVAVSLGVGNECSWDMEIHRRGAKVRQFDGTIDRPPSESVCTGIEFRKVNVGYPGLTLGDISAIINHLYLPSLRLKRFSMKCDIEGAEWTFLDNSALLAEYAQIVVEFHFFMGNADNAQIICTIERIRQNFTPIHIHGNNHRKLCQMDDGRFYPQVLEVSFANNAIFPTEDFDFQYPTNLDFPNRASRPEFSYVWSDGVLTCLTD